MILALFLLSSPASFSTPTPLQFVDALAKFTGEGVSAADIRRLSCKGFGAEEPTEARCRWQQRVDGKWKCYSTYVAIDGRGWQLIDKPYSKR